MRSETLSLGRLDVGGPHFPLIISCDETKQILWASLRPGTVHAALGADDNIAYVVTRLRQTWPDVVRCVHAKTAQTLARH